MAGEQIMARLRISGIVCEKKSTGATASAQQAKEEAEKPDLTVEKRKRQRERKKEIKPQGC